MKKLFKEFFYVPKYGKVREKVMLMHVTMSVVIIVMCLAAMSLSAYAYFSYNITSGSNTIKAANFEANVLISITENDSSTAVNVTKSNNASYTADIKAGKTYTVILDESQNSTAKTGFCIVTATGCADMFHSQQIGTDATVENGYTDKVTFQLKATADTTVTFLSHWGTSSYYDEYVEKGEGGRLYITNANVDDNRVLLIINGVSEADCDANMEHKNTTGSDNTGATTPTTESTNQSEQTTPSETTEMSEPTTLPEPSSPTEPSVPANTTEPATTESEETTESTETQPNEETTGAPTIEASE